MQLWRRIISGKLSVFGRDGVFANARVGNSGFTWKLEFPRCLVDSMQIHPKLSGDLGVSG